MAEQGAADGPIPVTFTPATKGRGGRIAFSNVGTSMQLSPTADCRSVGGLPANADKSGCCQQPLASHGTEASSTAAMAADQPRCGNIGGAGMCYNVMAIKRLVGLDGANCCAACAALPTCGAWQVNIEPGSKQNFCALKPFGYKAKVCTNPSLPNTSASGTSGTLPPSPPTGGVRAGFPFELRKQDGSYVTARAVVEGATVTLTPESESGIESDLDYGGSAGTFVGFRYAWHPFPLCVLTNGNGLPAAPIEQYDSDSWQ